jgi:hypothetical protein
MSIEAGRPNAEERRAFAAWLGRKSYLARVERFGIERIREIARENGKKGGRPRKVEEVER